VAFCALYATWVVRSVLYLVGDRLDLGTSPGTLELVRDGIRWLNLTDSLNG
jgi:hypothetical protein